MSVYTGAEQPSHSFEEPATASSKVIASEPVYVSNDSESTKPSTESTKDGLSASPFHYQFGEVEKAIANFTKHQPFNHHYAPNVHMNRNRNHYNNNNGYSNSSLRQNSGHNNSNNNSNGSNNGSSYNNVASNSSNNGGMFQHQANFAMTAQLKHQQHQQFLSQGIQHLNRFKSSSGNMTPMHQQQQQSQHQQMAVPYSMHVTQYVSDSADLYHHDGSTSATGYVGNNDLKFNAFQARPPHLTHQDLMSPLGASPSSPTFSPTVSGFATSPMEPMAQTSSFLVNTATQGQQQQSVHSLGESTTSSSSAYLGNIWGNSKSLGNSKSVWA